METDARSCSTGYLTYYYTLIHIHTCIGVATPPTSTHLQNPEKQRSEAHPMYQKARLNESKQLRGEFSK